MGFIVRSRFQQNAEEERASLFHAGRELKNSRNNILKLKTQSGMLTRQEDIEGEVINFFGALFNGHHNTSLQDTGIPFVPDYTCLNEMLAGLHTMDIDDSINLEMNITSEELEYVVGKCSYNKAPGIDGLCYEFYRGTWSLIKNTFLQVL